MKQSSICKMFSRMVSLLVCLSLFLCCFSFNAYAEDEEETQEEPLTSELFEEGMDYTIYENSDGSYTLDYYTGPIRYFDEEGGLHDRKTERIDDEGSYSSSDDRVKAFFPSDLDKENTIDLSFDGYSLKMYPLYEKTDDYGNSEETKEKSFLKEENRAHKVSYYDETSGARLVYYPFDSGVKEEIVLSERPEKGVFSFCLKAEKAQFREEKDGSIGIYLDDRLFAVITIPFLMDARGVINEKDIYYKLSDINDDSVILDLVVDEDYLDAASYPVTIDPTVTFTETGELYDTFVRSSLPNNNYYNSGAFILPYGAQEDGQVSRSYIFFNGLHALIQGKSVTQAKLKLYQKDVPAVTSSIEVHRVDEAWNPSAITWNSQPLCNGTASATKSSTSTQNQLREFDITNLVKSWANGSYSNYGIMLKSADEESETYGTFYGSREINNEDYRPCLSVTYTTGPSAPGNILVEKLNELPNAGAADLKISFSPVSGSESYWLRIRGDSGNTIERNITGELTTSNGKKVWKSLNRTIFSGYAGFPNDASTVLGSSSNIYYVAIGAKQSGSKTYSSDIAVEFADTTPPSAVSNNILITRSLSNTSADISVEFEQTSDLPLHGASGIDYYLVRLCNSAGQVIDQQNVEADPSMNTLTCLFSSVSSQSDAYVGIKAFDNNGNSPSLFSRSNSFDIIDNSSPQKPTITVDPSSWSSASSFDLNWTGVTDSSDPNPGVYYKLFRRDGGQLTLIRDETLIGSGYSGSGTIAVAACDDGPIEVRAYAKDAEGNVSESAGQTYHKDTHAPLIDITSANNSQFNNILVIRGSITDEFSSPTWKVEYSAPGSSVRTEVARGSHRVDGIIASIDVQDFLNGSYTFYFSAEDEAGNTDEISRIFVKDSQSDGYVEPVFTIRKDIVEDGVWYLDSLTNPIVLQGNVPQGERKLIVDEQTQTSSSAISLASLDDPSDESRHFPYVRISTLTQDYYSVPVYSSRDPLLEMMSFGPIDPIIPINGEMQSLDSLSDPVYETDHYFITDTGDIDKFKICLDLSGTDTFYCYIAKGAQGYVRISPDTYYYVDELYSGTYQINESLGTGTQGSYDVCVVRLVSGGDNTMSRIYLDSSVSMVSTRLAMYDSEYFTIRTVEKPENLTAANDYFSALLRWDPIADPDATYNIYRSLYEEDNYTLIASGISQTYYTDSEIEYGGHFRYLVKAFSDGRESAPSNCADIIFVEENEIYRHLGLEDRYEYQSFSDGYGNGYVELYDGNLVYSIIDGQVNAGLFSLTARRTYNSSSHLKTPLGYGWDINFNTRIFRELSEGAEQAVVLKDGDGSIHRFEKSANGYLSPIGETLKLEYLTDHYEVHRDDGISYVFDEQNRLYRMESRSGDFISFSYNSRGNLSQVTNSSGQSILFTYYFVSGKLDLLSGIVFPDSSGIAFDYTDGYLTSVSETLTSYVQGVAGSARSLVSYYFYDDGVLSSIRVPCASDSIGYTELSFSYENGRISGIEFPEDQSLEFTYSGASRSILSRIENQIFSSSYIQYNSEGLCSSKTDPAGNSVGYSYDADQNITSIFFDEQYYDSSFILQNRQISYSFEYDQLHNLTSIVDPMGHETTYQYSDPFNPYSMTRSIVPQSDSVNMITDYEYDEDSGNLLSVDDPLSRTSEYEYDELKPYLLVSSTDEYGTITSYSYDSHGRLVSSSLGLGGSDSITSSINSYDAMGRPLITSDPESHISFYQYDEKGNLVSFQNGNQCAYYEYYPNGMIRKQTDSAGTVTTYYYDQLCRPVRTAVNETNGGSFHETSYSYEYVTLNSELVFKVTTSETEGSDSAVTCVNYYNGAGQLIRQDKEGMSASARYNARGDVIEIIQSSSPDVRYVYDENGNVLKTKVEGNSGSAIVYESTYDYAGNVLTSADAKGIVTSYSYDVLGRLTSLSEGNGTVTTTYSYGNTAQNDQIMNSYTDPNGLRYETYLDRAGRIVKERQVGVDSLSIQDLYTYDRNSNLLSHVNGDNSQVGYVYDAHNNLLRENRTDSYTQYTYDSLNRLVTMADRDNNDQLIYGTDLTYAYDSLSRVVQYVEAGEAISYGYTPDGMVSSITYSDRINTSATSSGSEKISYVYNADRLLSSITLSRYDGNDQLLNQYTLADYIYNSDNTLHYRRVYRNFENSATNSIRAYYTYDEFYRIKKIENKKGTDTRESYAYTYDENSNITKEVSKNYDVGSTITSRYTYDDLSRLVGTVRTIGTSNKTASYTYDDAGNRISMSKGSLTTFYTYNSLNQLVSSVEEVKYKKNIVNVSTSYTYDDNGSLILTQETGRPVESYGVSSLYYPNAYLIKGDLSKDSETEYSYDDKRRLIQTDSTVSLSGSVTKLVVNGVTQNYVKTIDEEVSSSQGLYTYNGNDQRVVRTISTEYNEIRENGIDSYTASLTRKYCYSGSAILFETDSSNNKVIHNYPDPEGTVLISKRFGSGSSACYSFTYDIRGSVSSLYNKDGTAKLNYVYDEYGNIISRSTDTFYSDLAFTGAVYDEDISLYYLNARYYDPSLGVFISRDTYKGSIYSSITHNLYSYTGNNPVNFIDPTGHMMDMIDYQPGGRSGSTGGGVDPNTGRGSSQATQTGIVDNDGTDLLDNPYMKRYENSRYQGCRDLHNEMYQDLYNKQSHVSAVDLTKAIDDHLITECKRIRKERKYFRPSTNMLFWISRNLNEYDYKNRTDSFLDEYVTKDNPYFSYNGIVMTKADFGNFAYGVYGSEEGFSVPVLIFAGGVFAGLSGSNGFKQNFKYTGGDDMIDIAMCQYGSEIYKKLINR